MIETRLVRGIREYRFLIDRGYNPKSALKLVENRYLLNKLERDVIYRGVYTKIHDNVTREALRRGQETIEKKREVVIYVDFFNNMTTIIEALRGGLLSIGSDGLLRDHAKASGVGKKEEQDYFMACSMIEKFNPEVSYVFVGEKSISMSLKIIRRCVEILSSKGINASFHLTDRVDSYLLEKSNSIDAVISSSDHLIAERAKRVIDIPMALIGEIKADSRNIIDIESIIYDIEYQFY